MTWHSPLLLTSRVPAWARRAKRAVDGGQALPRWVAHLARLGYGAKGIVYIAMGTLSAVAASRYSGEPVSSTEALQRIAGAWWGGALLVLVVVGLAGYVVWRVVQAVLDPEDQGDDVGGLATRALHLGSAAVYGVIGWTALRILLGQGSGGSSDGGTRAAGSLLRLPGGRLVVGAVGLAVIVYGLKEFHQAFSKGFTRKLTMALGGELRRWAVRFGRVGLAARGVVFLIVGGFFLYSAVLASSGPARSTEGALSTLQVLGGPWAMGLVAVGLGCYGVFQLGKARYRRIPG